MRLNGHYDPFRLLWPISTITKALALCAEKAYNRPMKVAWKPEKNEWLKKERDLSFEEIEEAIASGRLIAVLENKNHKNQVILVIEIDGYAIAVPTLIKTKVIFFMTAYPSSALTKKYGRKNERKKD